MTEILEMNKRIVEERMNYQSLLIKYAEIGIKGKNRYLFEDALVKQIRFALKPIEGSFVVSKESGRIYANAEAGGCLEFPVSVRWFRSMIWALRR